MGWGLECLGSTQTLFYMKFICIISSNHHLTPLLLPKLDHLVRGKVCWGYLSHEANPTWIIRYGMGPRVSRKHADSLLHEIYLHHFIKSSSHPLLLPKLDHLVRGKVCWGYLSHEAYPTWILRYRMGPGVSTKRADYLLHEIYLHHFIKSSSHPPPSP